MSGGFQRNNQNYWEYGYWEYGNNGNQNSQGGGTDISGDVSPEGGAAPFGEDTGDGYDNGGDGNGGP
jgi:hypothetical protein